MTSVVGINLKMLSFNNSQMLRKKCLILWIFTEFYYKVSRWWFISLWINKVEFLMISWIMSTIRNSSTRVSEEGKIGRYIFRIFQSDLILEIFPWGTPFGGPQKGQLGVNISHKIWLLAQIIVIDMTGVNRSSVP